MKRGTKRAVGWGAGVSIGIVFVLLTFILVVGLSGAQKAAPEGDEGFKLDLVDNVQEQHAPEH